MANPFQGRAGQAYGGGGMMSPIGGGNTPSAAPVSGQGAFGKVPGAISVPQSRWAELSGVLPNFGELTSGTTGLIGSQQRGEVSQATMDALKRGAAEWGVSIGMPGAGLTTNRLFGNLAGFTEGLQEKGVQNYMNLLGTSGALQTDPNLVSNISERNALYAAAPDPEAAYNRMEADRLKWYNITKRDQLMPRTPGLSGWQLQNYQSGPSSFGGGVGQNAALDQLLYGGSLGGGGGGMRPAAIPGFSGQRTPMGFHDYGPNQILYGPGGGPGIGGFGEFQESPDIGDESYYPEYDWSNVGG